MYDSNKYISNLHGFRYSLTPQILGPLHSRVMLFFQFDHLQYDYRKNFPAPYHLGFNGPSSMGALTLSVHKKYETRAGDRRCVNRIFHICEILAHIVLCFIY